MVRQWYEELGGEVVLLGKPAAVLYEEALRMLGLRKDEVLAIGDSLQHDIAGAAPLMAMRWQSWSYCLPWSVGGGRRADCDSGCMLGCMLLRA